MANQLEYEEIKLNEQKLKSFMQLCGISDENKMKANLVLIDFNGELIKCIANQDIRFEKSTYLHEQGELKIISFVNDQDIFNELRLHYSAHINYQVIDLNEERKWLRITNEDERVYFYIEGV
ncbi:hypothetical protein [Paenibacillus agricola]|uniref:Uncharacterized protein n=1 Tax=Paenibacillus agricola TaxID=2716264 RepID=A0ABX0J1T5_9BACL|nr:hypothetical protein [Paenibacillus agricola]NHN29643.1 hypothetical protein [Paenibacillus agricola]